MAQAIHASFGFAQVYSSLTNEWLRDSQFLIVVSVPDEHALKALSDEASDRGIPQYLWHEPDLDDQATAVALAPGLDSRRLCANLPLAGREPVPV
jgi:peptidyl-tRNA hydrolase